MCGRETLRIFLQDTLLVDPAAQLEHHLPHALIRLTASPCTPCGGGPLDGALAFDRHMGLACDASDAPMLALLGVVAAATAALVPAPLPSAA